MVSFSNNYKYQLIWSVQEEGFICIEPWTAKADALNTKEDLISIKPGECMKSWIEISIKNN